MSKTKTTKTKPRPKNYKVGKAFDQLEVSRIGLDGKLYSVAGRCQPGEKKRTLLKRLLQELDRQSHIASN